MPLNSIDIRYPTKLIFSWCNFMLHKLKFGLFNLTTTKLSQFTPSIKYLSFASKKYGYPKFSTTKNWVFKPWLSMTNPISWFIKIYLSFVFFIKKLSIVFQTLNSNFSETDFFRFYGKISSKRFILTSCFISRGK